MATLELMVRKHCLLHPDMDHVSAERAVMKQEAKNRMQIMRLHSNAVKDFMERDVLNRSETNIGSLYWLTEEEVQMVKDWEAENGYLVYHVLKNNLHEIGLVYSLFYVSRETSDWKGDRADLKEGCPFVYCLNKSCPIFSEFGRIGVEYRFGGVVRIA